MNAKQDRADEANRLLRVIAFCGRRFFNHNGGVSQFSVERDGKVWFTDSYSGRRIYTQHRGRWRGFTNGGTLRTLIEQLRDYIRTGDRPALNLGPWPVHICDGDLWGYGHDMQKVRDAAANIWPQGEAK